jgi:hypothetical protein
MKLGPTILVLFPLRENSNIKIASSHFHYGKVILPFEFLLSTHSVSDSVVSMFHEREREREREREG